ncbi:MAG: sugar ABC transporter ATP-binding protein [Chloroflexota bacterium]|nr:sugar ABC transporter ATP-binding protein [Chloroflexota bacterium]
MSEQVPRAATDKPEMIRLEHITKRFGGVTALRDVSFSIAKGEIHAIVGENGAGKSTLMKILAGIYQPDSGQVYLRGEPVTLNSPLHARAQGVSIVSQELALFPHLSIAANIFANREKSHGGVLDKRTMRDEARQVLVEMGVALDPMRKVGSLAVGEKQIVEIARTLHQQSDIVIMDEPNSALNAQESERLFEILRGLRERGLTIIYVSHRLEEVFAISDRITVVRDGQYQGTRIVAETTIPEIITAMIGRQLEESFPHRAPVAEDAPVVLSVRNLAAEPALRDVSFDLRAGEILGFAGLEGSGTDDIFNVLFGLRGPTGGEIAYSDGRPRATSPFQAIKQGLALVPANRREEGLMTAWSIRRNTSLPVLDRLLFALGVIDRKGERDLARDYVRRLNVATDSIDKRVVNLSGGNQQKVVLAKWMATGPTVLLLNDPTRGVDVGAKAEIYALCAQLAAEGLALLFTSSEIEETIGLCDRVKIMYKGRAIREFGKGEATKADITWWISGGDSTANLEPVAESA